MLTVHMQLTKIKYINVLYLADDEATRTDDGSAYDSETSLWLRSQVRPDELEAPKLSK